MKRTAIMLCSLFLATGMTIPAWGYTTPSDRPALYVSLLRFQAPDTDPQPEPETHPTGHRSNRLPLSGTISADGVSIPEVDASEILSFEIYTPEGFCMGAFVDEADFIEYLFSLSGEYEVRFTTEEAVYVGFVEV